MDDVAWVVTDGGREEDGRVFKGKRGTRRGMMGKAAGCADCREGSDVAGRIFSID